MRTIWRALRAGHVDLGWVAIYAWDIDAYRPSVWVRLRRWYLVIWFGWQWPSIDWIPR